MLIHIEEAPPVRFDLARQVRVFEPYLQYVELSLSGASIQRHHSATRMGKNSVGSAAAGIRKPWKMRRERKSPSYTTDWDELLVVF